MTEEVASRPISKNLESILGWVGATVMGSFRFYYQSMGNTSADDVLRQQHYKTLEQYTQAAAGASLGIVVDGYLRAIADKIPVPEKIKAVVKAAAAPAAVLALHAGVNHLIDPQAGHYLDQVYKTFSGYWDAIAQISQSDPRANVVDIGGATVMALNLGRMLKYSAQALYRLSRTKPAPGS